MKTANNEEFVSLANAWITEKMQAYSAHSIFLPAGETPRPLYAAWRADLPDFLRGLELHQLDEVLDGSRAGMFAEFFRRELPGLTVLPPVAERTVDLGLLGLGPNGHVAFHEPGLAPDFTFGEVILKPESAKRIGASESTKARTYGVGAFNKCRALLLVVRGAGKLEVLKRAQAGDLSLPVAHLLRHSDLTILNVNS